MRTESTGIHIKGSYTLGERQLFDHLDLHLKAGEWTCLLGSSGVGKSTLLRLLAGLPTEGQFSGEIVRDDATESAHNHPQRRRGAPPKIAFMAQSDLLFPWLSLIDNVMLGSRLRGEPQQQARARELIRRVGLAGDETKKPHQLSGGMRQRTALARTLLEDTPIVLLDEPFSALDTRNRRKMQQLAYEMLQGKTVLLVTHDPTEALCLADNLYVMTESGLLPQPLPPTPAPRRPEDPELIAAQSRVLTALNAV